MYKLLETADTYNHYARRLLHEHITFHWTYSECSALRIQSNSSLKYHIPATAFSRFA